MKNRWVRRIRRGGRRTGYRTALILPEKRYGQRRVKCDWTDHIHKQRDERSKTPPLRLRESGIHDGHGVEVYVIKPQDFAEPRRRQIFWKKARQLSSIWKDWTHGCPEKHRLCGRSDLCDWRLPSGCFQQYFYCGTGQHRGQWRFEKWDYEWKYYLTSVKISHGRAAV